jgi:hypothetical protein
MGYIWWEMRWEWQCMLREPAGMEFEALLPLIAYLGLGRFHDLVLRCQMLGRVRFVEASW